MGPKGRHQDPCLLQVGQRTQQTVQSTIGGLLRTENRLSGQHCLGNGGLPSQAVGRMAKHQCAGISAGVPILRDCRSRPVGLATRRFSAPRHGEPTSLGPSKQCGLRRSKDGAAARFTNLMPAYFQSGNPSLSGEVFDPFLYRLPLDRRHFADHGGQDNLQAPPVCCRDGHNLEAAR